MGFGLGYIADGLLKGQERNLNLGLRRNQERREETKFGLQVPVFEAKAQEAKEFMSDESKLARANKQTNDGVISNNNATISGYDAIIKGNDASTQNIARTNREREAKALGAESLAKGYGLGNTIKQQQIDLTNLGPLSKEGRDLLENKNKYDLESQAWEHKMREAVNQKDKLKAMMDLSEVKLNREFRVIELARSGNTKAAASLINGFSDNPYKNVADAVFTKEGGITGYNEKGEIVAEYTPKEVASIELEIRNKEAKAREAKARTPTVKTFDRPVLDENGKQLIDQLTGEPLTKKVQAQWDGESWQEVSPNSRGEGAKQPSNAALISAGQSLVQRGVKTPEWFESKFKQPYSPSSNQNNSSRNELSSTTNSVSIPRPPSREPQGANNQEWTQEELNNPLMNL